MISKMKKMKNDKLIIVAQMLYAFQKTDTYHGDTIVARLATKHNDMVERLWHDFKQKKTNDMVA